MTISVRPSGGRVAVIGDVGGHLGELRAELARLGADERSGRLPDDLIVVQVGDLIHRGPESPAVVALVNGYLTRQPDQWIQLVGNHEAQYLRPPAFDWPEQLDTATVETLQKWWKEGQMRVAVSVTTDTEEFLISHAGLTRAVWREVLGGPSSAAGAATSLDLLIGDHDDAIFRPGHMLRGRRPDPLAGPVWAVAGSELIGSWLGTRLPFSQVHGHTSIFDRPRRRAPIMPAVARLTRVDGAARHETTTLDGGRIIGIDPGHGRRARTPWRALQLNDSGIYGQA